MGLRQALSRWASSAEELEAEALQDDAEEVGATRCCDLPDREPARVCGTLRTVTVRPRAGVPALEAELYDGSGVVSVVWLGRRRIPGIDPGRGVVAEGRVTRDHGRAVIFNPRYTLLPGSR